MGEVDGEIGATRGRLARSFAKGVLRGGEYEASEESEDGGEEEESDTDSERRRPWPMGMAIGFECGTLGED